MQGGMWKATLKDDDNPEGDGNAGGDGEGTIGAVASGLPDSSSIDEDIPGIQSLSCSDQCQ